MAPTRAEGWWGGPPYVGAGRDGLSVKLLASRARARYLLVT